MSRGPNESRLFPLSVRTVVSLVALLLLVVFVAVNFETVTVDLLVARAEVRLGFALIFAALLGLVAGWAIPRRGT